MSILLEALRKSEKNQQPHEAPTIHDDDQVGPIVEPLKIAPLAMLLVVALFVTGWLVWRQYQAPPGDNAPPVTLEPNQANNAAGSAQVQQAGDGGTPVATQPGPATEIAASQQRTPVETFEAGAKTAPQAKPPKARDTASGGSAKPVAGGGASKPAPEPKPAATAQPTRPAEPAPISYWELPDAIRASVPEIKFSVLVYANNPDDRFVLINGQRYGEGDSLPSGPVVGEIRREGVVFTYRLYRFLVER